MAGAGFCVSLILSVGALNVPRDATDAEVLEFWSTSGNRVAAMASMLLMVTAAIALLVFAGRLRQLHRSASTAAGPVDTAWSFASACSASLVVAAACRGAIAAAVESGNEPLPGTDLLRYLPSLGTTVLGTGAMALAAAYVAAVALATRRSATATTAMTVFSGVVVVIVAVAAAAGLGPLAIPVFVVWVGVTSVRCWRGKADRSTVRVTTVDDVRVAS
jgi:hypothetical protein